MRRRGIGRPVGRSLVGTAARTAVIAGTATAVAGRVASNQSARAQPVTAAPTEAPEPPAAPASQASAAFPDEVYDQLKKLAELRDAGILTDDEFQSKKRQILGS